MSEGFVHNTRCANIFEALSVGIAQFSLRWLNWTGRHQSLVGAQTAKALQLQWLKLGLGSRHWHGKYRKGIMGN